MRRSAVRIRAVAPLNSMCYEKSRGDGRHWKSLRKRPVKTSRRTLAPYADPTPGSRDGPISSSTRPAPSATLPRHPRRPKDSGLMRGRFERGAVAPPRSPLGGFSSRPDKTNRSMTGRVEPGGTPFGAPPVRRYFYRITARITAQSIALMDRPMMMPRALSRSSLLAETPGR